MKLAGAMFKFSKMRYSLWNRALYCKTLHKECCGCQNFTWFKRKIGFFVAEKYVAV